MKLKNQAGFSLVQVLIAAGLIGVVSLGVAQLMVESSRVAKSNQTKIDQMVLVSKVSGILLTEKQCSDAIKNQPYNNALASTKGGQEIRLIMPDGEVYQKGNTVAGTNLEFHSLKIKNSSFVDNLPSGGRIYSAGMSMQLKSNNNLVGGSLYNEKDIANFYITTDAANQLQTCSSQLGVSYICSQLQGGTYDPATHKCTVKPQPKETCDAIKGKFDPKTGTCNQFAYKNCGKYKHGQTYSTTSGGSCGFGGGTKTKTVTNYQCLDGTIYKTSTSKHTIKCAFSCFTASTNIRMHDGSLKRIDQIKVGDQVLGENDMINTVEEIETPDLGERKLFSLNNDGNYFVTAEHPFRSTRGWVSLSPEDTAHEHNFLVLQEPMSEGDYLYKFNSVPLRLEAIDSKKYHPKTKVYNLLLDGNNTYYANDYLVHNKDVK